MNKVRNVHSPAGMGYTLTGTRLVHLKDCPKCKFGTLDARHDDQGKLLFWECADCGARLEQGELIN